MALHLFQSQGQDRCERLVRGRTEREVIGLQMANRFFPFTPADKQQRRTVAASLGRVAPFGAAIGH